MGAFKLRWGSKNERATRKGCVCGADNLVCSIHLGRLMKAANDDVYLTVVGEPVPHTIASAVLAGYYIKLTKIGDKYQVDYGADSQPFDSFTEATQAFKQALYHAGALEGLTDEEAMG